LFVKIYSKTIAQQAVFALAAVFLTIKFLPATMQITPPQKLGTDAKIQATREGNGPQRTIELVEGPNDSAELQSTSSGEGIEGKRGDAEDGDGASDPSDADNAGVGFLATGDAGKGKGKGGGSGESDCSSPSPPTLRSVWVKHWRVMATVALYGGLLFVSRTARDMLLPLVSAHGFLWALPTFCTASREVPCRGYPPRCALSSSRLIRSADVRSPLL
jgi:hypothetical protein